MRVNWDIWVHRMLSIWVSTWLCRPFTSTFAMVFASLQTVIASRLRCRGCTDSAATRADGSGHISGWATGHARHDASKLPTRLFCAFCALFPTESKRNTCFHALFLLFIMKTGHSKYEPSIESIASCFWLTQQGLVPASIRKDFCSEQMMCWCWMCKTM